jgi:SEC-C motif
MYDFEKDIMEGLEKYPSLKLISKRQVRGMFSALQKETEIWIEDYEVIINFPLRYPFALPDVAEVSNKIPKTVSRHVFSDSGNLCFGNMIDVAQVCLGGISFIWFLENILNPHLCREYVKEVTGDYPNGERSHSPEGHWESYYDLLGTRIKEDILAEITLALKSPNLQRNDQCRCDSGKKYKNCHLKTERLILEVGHKNLQMIYGYLKLDFETKKNN